MNRMIRAAAAAAILTSGLGSIGCVHTDSCSSGGGGSRLGNCYRNFVDPCYPERYERAAREAVLYPFAQQTYNGHVLNQTIYNYYFEFGTDRLTPAGIEKLTAIARTRPAPDPRLYLQTARDIPANVDPAKIPDVRTDLDNRRAAVIQKYMAGEPAFAPVAYEIFVHDPIVPSIKAEMALRAYNGSYLRYIGNVSGGGTGVLGTGSGGGSLTAPPGGGGGGGFGPSGGPGVGTGGGFGGPTP